MFQIKCNILIREFRLKLRIIYTKDNNQVNANIYNSIQSTLVTLPNRSWFFYTSKKLWGPWIKSHSCLLFRYRIKSFSLQIITSRLSAINPKYRCISRPATSDLPSPFPLHLSRSRASINGHPKVTTDTERLIVQSCGVKANHLLDEAEGACRSFRLVSPVGSPVLWPISSWKWLVGFSCFLNWNSHDTIIRATSWSQPRVLYICTRAPSKMCLFALNELWSVSGLTEKYERERERFFNSSLIFVNLYRGTILNLYVKEVF